MFYSDQVHQSHSEIARHSILILMTDSDNNLLKSTRNGNIIEIFIALNIKRNEHVEWKKTVGAPQCGSIY